MKTSILSIFIFAVLATCQSKNTYTIHGCFKDEPAEEWIYLEKFDFEEDHQHDSALIKKGRFEFTGTIQLPEVFEIRYNPRANGTNLPIFLEPGKFEVIIDPDDLELGSFIKGGTLNEEYKKILMLKSKNKEKFTPFDDDPENYLTNYALAAKLNQEFNDYCSTYIQSNPGSPISIYLLKNNFSMLPLEEQGNLITQYTSEVHHMDLYKKYKTEYDNQVNLVNRTPAYIISKNSIRSFEIDFSKSTILQTLIDQNPGKPMFIDIWGTWCGPCIASFPRMKELGETLGYENIQFVYLCARSLEDKWKDMIVDENLIGQHYLLGNKQLERLTGQLGKSILSYPTYLIINKEGKVCLKPPRPQSEKIEDLLLSLI